MSVSRLEYLDERRRCGPGGLVLLPLEHAHLLDQVLPEKRRKHGGTEITNRANVRFRRIPPDLDSSLSSCLAVISVAMSSSLDWLSRRENSCQKAVRLDSLEEAILGLF